MAFNGYLIKIGGSNGTILPMKFIKYEEYKISPDQRLEVEAERVATGLLVRNTVEHTASKIEFSTPPITNRDVAELNGMIQAAYTNELEKKLTIEYYNPELDNYKTAEVYVPTVPYDMTSIQGNVIQYKSLRYAFIEY